jgi:hypothetical protein
MLVGQQIRQVLPPQLQQQISLSPLMLALLLSLQKLLQH